MSENTQAPGTFHEFNYDSRQDEELNRLLVDEYSALDSLFPHSIRQVDQPYMQDGKRMHEFMLTVGEPEYASAIFTSNSLEVGGPTLRPNLKTVKGEFRPSIVTNIELGEGVDEIANAARLHYQGGSFDAVFASNLPGLNREQSADADVAMLHDDFMREAFRVLRPGGWLLMSGAGMKDLKSAMRQGFNIEVGNGCIVSRLAITEGVSKGVWEGLLPRMSMEFLLHR